MKLTRRELFAGTGAAVTLGLAARARLVSARGILTEPGLDDIVERALAAAKKAGASWADVRIVRRRSESVSTREDHVTGVGSSESYGIGVRVIASGAWGFAAASRVEVAEAERVARLAVDIAKANATLVKAPVTLAPEPAHVDVWQTPLTKDPFKIPLAEKVELLLAINAEVMKVKGVTWCDSRFGALAEWKLYANSDGASIEQEIVRLGPGYSATATDPRTGEFVTRSHELPPRQAGWEYVEDAPLLADARQIGEDAVAKLKAPSVAPGKKDLILAPTHLWLTIHESIGHPTELDRALGYEANFAGTSFITPDQTGKLKIAAPSVDFYADKTTPGGLATVGYDDDGVKTQRWDIVKNGVFVGWQTTRDQAGWIGEQTSRGTSYAQDFRSFPFQRMPNLSLAPGGKALGVADLIAATDDGIYITGNGSYSIDHQRYNFQFGGQMFYEVKKGKITRILKDVAYQARTTDFWRSVDLIGGAKEWVLGGTLSDGKGEPSQSNAVSHGCPPTRFRGVNVINTNERKRGGTP
jgi:TldD protein